MAASNRVVLINRMRAASRNLKAAIEESRSCFVQYTRDGGEAYTDPFFYVDEDLNGTLRTDLDITKEQTTSAFVAINAICNDQRAPGAGINDYMPSLDQVV